MRSTDLTPEDPGAFQDFPLMPVREGRTLCPTCKGHGGWNLVLNAYPLHGRPSTPYNRHRLSHQLATCTSCWGHGYLAPGQTCAHEWSRGANVGRCLREWTCVKCGQVVVVNSSD